MRSLLRLPALALSAHVLVVVLILLFAGTPTTTLAQTPAGRGFVDLLHYDAAEHRLQIGGWAATERANVFTSNIVITIGERQVYRGRFERLERPDVVDATGRRDWLWSGWRVKLAVPADMSSGAHPVRVRFVLTDGATFDVSATPGTQTIDIPWRRTRSTRAAAVAIVAVLLPLLSFIGANALARALAKERRAKVIFGVSMAASFLLLVAVGLTGSSLKLALEASPVTRDDAVDWFGKSREIRADEWRVLTPMAIGQFNHDPPLPIVNRNVGIDGQNMLVIGMTGVPVAHISALAKPATWGFFLFDLRRALAWYWWFPVFGCFAALWLLLLRIFRIEWRLAAALALSVAASPYSMAFSGWPAYTTFFPALAIVAADGALRERRALPALVYGAVAGWSVAGFVLVLYPAWQISLTYLLLPFAVAAFIRARGHFAFGRAQLAAAVAAVLVCALPLQAWWLSARDAIATIAATIYPGQRTTVVGGDIDAWFLAKGLLSAVTMYRGSPLMDQTDAGSFVYLLLPLAVGVVFTWIVARSIDAISAVLLAFIAVALAFMYIGFPSPLAEYTLWGRTSPFRMDLALGFAQMLLIGWLIAARRDVRVAERRWSTGVAVITAVVAAALSAAQFLLVPVPIADTVSPAVFALSCAALGVVSYLLLMERYAWAVGIHCAWMLGASLPFNPLGQAPTSVTAAPGWSTPAAIDQRRVAIIGEHTWTTMVVAAGQPVVDTVLYYPQPSLWKVLDPSGAQQTLYNRYQHLLFEIAPLPPGPAHQIDSQRLDAVRVTFDPQRFDFRELEAGGVLTSERSAAALAQNPSLHREAGQDGWVFYRIVR